MIRFVVALLILFCCSVQAVKAQEYISYSKTYNPNTTHKAKTKATPLPFFDDFSANRLNTNLWQATNAYVNTTFAQSPPSIGVVTFDAVDANGDFYAHAIPNTAFTADELTSQPIDLNGTNNVFLSFFYQSGAHGDVPELNDTLLVEFFDTNTETWNKTWYVTGKLVRDFKQVIIPVQPNYLTTEFQFRFRNYASLSGTQTPSLVTNADHWHIDYVKLDANRSETDTVYNDIAFLAPVQSVLKNYESIPWLHFKAASNIQYKENLYVEYRNNDNQIRLIDTLSFVVQDKLGFAKTDTIFAGSYNLNPSSPTFFDNPVSIRFQPNEADSASFEIKARLATDGFDFQGNNQAVYYQEFKNFYCYDDGSAEKGYGIIGQGAQNAMLALQFTPLVPDQLTHIGMYFNKTYQNAGEKYFYLTVWDDNNGQPGNMIYKQQGVLPQYSQEINRFVHYPLDTILNLTETFYIGWVQTTDDLLNIGFDANRNASEKTFYNINGSWKQSTKEGAIMMRAVFAKDTIKNATNITPIKQTQQANLYPNPASDFIIVQLPHQQLLTENPVVEIYSLEGKMLLRQTIYEQQTLLNIEHLQNGIYLSRIRTKQKVFAQKIIIRK